MSRGTWDIIKQSKHFYVNTYRRTESMLLLSITINLIIGFAIGYQYLGRPEHDFYSTNGVTAPMLLTPMDSANSTSVALLASESNSETNIKVIPQ